MTRRVAITMLAQVPREYDAIEAMRDAINAFAEKWNAGQGMIDLKLLDRMGKAIDRVRGVKCK